MHKVWVVANREYQSAVRTKTFLISLLIMPIMMGASVLLQWLLKDVVDTDDKRFAVVDRTGRKDLVLMLDAALKVYNEATVQDGVRQKPRFVVGEPLGNPEDGDVGKQRLVLSRQVRDGKILGFLEILTKEQAGEKASSPIVLRYYTNRPTYMDFATLANVALGTYLRERTAQKVGIKSKETLEEILKPVDLENKGLVTSDAEGKVTEGSDGSRLGAIILPMVLMLLMFMVVLMGATPLMQGVVEEKMQRIAEVLLGSVRPFELMLGKLLGMTGVSLTIAAVYLGGAYWAANYFGMGEDLTADILIWFVLFQMLASLMFGALFIAIGAACTEMKETQTMVLPVMLLASIPMFLVGSVMREPNGAVVRALSFFPFATPSLMMGRLAIPPGLPWWEPVLGIAIVLATTLLCVYVASRIFRVGILLQGKGANLREMFRWIFRG